MFYDKISFYNLQHIVRLSDRSRGGTAFQLCAITASIVEVSSPSGTAARYHHCRVTRLKKKRLIRCY